MEEYLKVAFEELYNEDGLIVFGKGLGLLRLFCKFVRLHCSPPYDRKLTLCLNANDFHDIIKKTLSSEGVSIQHLPKVTIVVPILISIDIVNRLFVQ